MVRIISTLAKGATVLGLFSTALGFQVGGGGVCDAECKAKVLGRLASSYRSPLLHSCIDAVSTQAVEFCRS